MGNIVCDLCASIYLMPLSVFKSFGIEAVRPTSVTLHLVDLSIEYLECNIEDVSVKVDKFIFRAYFIILDYEENFEMPIILEHFKD